MQRKLYPTKGETALARIPSIIFDRGDVKHKSCETQRGIEQLPRGLPFNPIVGLISRRVAFNARSGRMCVSTKVETSCQSARSISQRARYILWGNISLTVSACRSSRGGVSHISEVYRLCEVPNALGIPSASFLFHFIPRSPYLFVYFSGPIVACY